MARNTAPYISVTKKLRPHWSGLYSINALNNFWISVTKKLRPHWSGIPLTRFPIARPISVTKKLRPHWSKTICPLLHAPSSYFRNQKVTAPLKHDRFRHGRQDGDISVTKKLRPHWSPLCRCYPLPHHQISVTKKLRPHWSVIPKDVPAFVELNFRNQKVTAPLKPVRPLSRSFRNFWISVTKKLRPHWSSHAPNGIMIEWAISVTKKLRPHWSMILLIALLWSIEDFRNQKVTAPLKPRRKKRNRIRQCQISVTKKLRPHWSDRVQF